MRFTYTLLNLIFMGIAWVGLRYFGVRSTRPRPEFFLALVALYAMMLAFNTYLTSLPIVTYTWEKTLGTKIISWPIEDLAYLVVALYAAPLVWERLKEFYERSDRPTTSAASIAEPSRVIGSPQKRSTSSKRRKKQR